MRTTFTLDHKKKGGEVVFKTTEAQLQQSVMRYLAYVYPNALAIHVPNEGKRSRFTAKKMGIKAGCPDVLIFERKSDIDFNLSGLAIELKVGDNKPTDKQLWFLRSLKYRGWATAICYSFDEAKKEIDSYLKAA